MMKSTSHKPRSAFLQIRNGVTDFFRKIHRQPNSQFPNSPSNSTSFIQNSEIMWRPTGDRRKVRLSEFVQAKYVHLAELSVVAAQNPSNIQQEADKIQKRRCKRSSRTRSFENRSSMRTSSNCFQPAEDADKENATEPTVKQGSVMPYGDHNQGSNQIPKTESSGTTMMRRLNSQEILQGIPLIVKISETQIPLEPSKSSRPTIIPQPNQTDRQKAEVKSEGEVSSEQTSWTENKEGDRGNKEEWVTQEFPLFKGFSHMSVGEVVSSHNINDKYFNDNFNPENSLIHPQSANVDGPSETQIIEMDLQRQARIDKEQKDEEDIKILIKTLERKLSKNHDQRQVTIDSNEQEKPNVIENVEETNFTEETDAISVELENNESSSFSMPLPRIVTSNSTEFNAHVISQLNSAQRQSNAYLDEYIRNSIIKTSPAPCYDSSFPRRRTVIPQLPPALDTERPHNFSHLPPIQFGSKIISAVSNHEQDQDALSSNAHLDENSPLNPNLFSFSGPKIKTPKVKVKKEWDSETKSRIVLAKKDRGPFWRIDMFERNRAKNKQKNGAYAVTFGIKLKKSIPQRQRRRRRRRGRGVNITSNLLRLLNTRKNRKLNKTNQEPLHDDYHNINFLPNLNVGTANNENPTFYPPLEAKFQTDPFLHSTSPLINSYPPDVTHLLEKNQGIRDNYSSFYNKRLVLDRIDTGIINENSPQSYNNHNIYHTTQNLDSQSKKYSRIKNKTRYDKISLAPILENSSKISSKTKTLLTTLVDSNQSGKHLMDNGNSNFNYRNQHGFGISKKSLPFDEKMLSKIYTPKTEFTRQFQFLLPSNRDTGFPHLQFGGR